MSKIVEGSGADVLCSLVALTEAATTWHVNKRNSEEILFKKAGS